MTANARAILIEPLRDAHRGQDELLSDPRLTLELLASREGKNVRSIRMTLSLAFLAPEIAKAAVEGRLRAALVSSVSSTCRWPGRISGARSNSRRRRRRKERSALARLPFREGLIHPTEPVECRGSNPQGQFENRARWARSKQQPWKRNFAARDFRRCAPGIAPENRRHAY
jgi:hypothetical protein